MVESLNSEGDINSTEERACWQATLDHQETQKLLDDDARYFLHQSMSTPCLDVLTRAEGFYIEDIRGRRYMDFHGNNVHQLGYGHPVVVKRVRDQLDTLPFSPRRFTNPVAIECARKLAGLCPDDLNRVLFAPGGTSVIGMALKLTRLVTGNHKVVSLWDSFHGASLDAIGVGGGGLLSNWYGAVNARRRTYSTSGQLSGSVARGGWFGCPLC
ncbi:aminotransferase class III-fold pyridoxal phosphate-dependent enzyme [Endozoicomonas atrinae]|uniref:aminotransferase class III-fold pyridoxal phosphate-dependent enzyme n=1 Tax=Endozoicomonas atrinae TaxID=1333660 RepID=UPI003B00AD56